MDIDLNNSSQKITTTVSATIDKVHIKVFKRNARKYITIVEGLDATFDLKAILKTLKKDILFCNGKVAKDKETDKLTLKLQGDHKDELLKFFQDELDINKDNIVVHGAMD